MKTQSYASVVAGFVALIASGCSVIPSSFNAPVPPTYAEANSNRTDLPSPVHTVRPEFPWSMRRAGIPGYVNVRCLIDAQGRVAETTVATATDDAFVKPALLALRQWQFKPAMRDGVAVPMAILVPIRFSLQE